MSNIDYIERVQKKYGLSLNGIADNLGIPYNSLITLMRNPDRSMSMKYLERFAVFEQLDPEKILYLTKTKIEQSNLEKLLYLSKTQVDQAGIYYLCKKYCDKETAYTVKFNVQSKLNNCDNPLSFTGSLIKKETRSGFTLVDDWESLKNEYDEYTKTHNDNSFVETSSDDYQEKVVSFGIRKALSYNEGKTHNTKAINYRIIFYHESLAKRIPNKLKRIPITKEEFKDFSEYTLKKAIHIINTSASNKNIDNQIKIQFELVDIDINTLDYLFLNEQSRKWLLTKYLSSIYLYDMYDYVNVCQLSVFGKSIDSKNANKPQLVVLRLQIYLLRFTQIIIQELNDNNLLNIIASKFHYTGSRANITELKRTVSQNIDYYLMVLESYRHTNNSSYSTGTPKRLIDQSHLDSMKYVKPEDTLQIHYNYVTTYGKDYSNSVEKSSHNIYYYHCMFIKDARLKNMPHIRTLLKILYSSSIYLPLSSFLKFIRSPSPYVGLGSIPYLSNVIVNLVDYYNAFYGEEYGQIETLTSKEITVSEDDFL